MEVLDFKLGCLSTLQCNQLRFKESVELVRLNQSRCISYPSFFSSICLVGLGKALSDQGPIKDQLMFWPPIVTYQSIKCSTISESIEPIVWSIKPKLCLTTCLGFQTLFKALNFFVFVRVLNLLWLLFEPWGSVFSNLHIN